MTSVLILGFLAGALFAIGLPHLVFGVGGRKSPTPFGNTNHYVNVVFGWVAWVIAVLLWHIAPMKGHPRAAFLAAAAGVLLMGLLKSYNCAKNARKLGLKD